MVKLFNGSNTFRKLQYKLVFLEIRLYERRNKRNCRQKAMKDNKQPPFSNGFYIIFHLRSDMSGQRIALKPGYKETLLLKTIKIGFLFILKK